MRCACNRWGPGTTIEKPTNTIATKELQEKLATMRNERMVQDTMWDTEPESTRIQKTDSIQVSQTRKK